MKMIKGALSIFTVALLALTFSACPPPEEEPAAFEGQDTVPTTGESPADTMPRDTPQGGEGGNGGPGGI